MGIQIIVKASTSSDIESALGVIAAVCEIFSIDGANWGISIPVKIIDANGEKNILALLDKLPQFDLWSGSWKMPAPG